LGKIGRYDREQAEITEYHPCSTSQSIYSFWAPGSFKIVQSPPPFRMLSSKPRTAKENHIPGFAARRASTKILCAHNEDAKPFQLILINFATLGFCSPAAGGAYRDRKGSILSLGSTCGLSNDISDIHSYISIEKSLKSSSYVSLCPSGGWRRGKWASICGEISGAQLTVTGKCLLRGSGETSGVELEACCNYLYRMDTYLVAANL
jgi:hypothetical protein